MGEPRKAIEYYKRALKIFKETGDRRGEGSHLGNLGIAYSDLGESGKAIEFLEMSFLIGKEIRDPIIIDLCEHQLNSLKKQLNKT